MFHLVIYQIGEFDELLSTRELEILLTENFYGLIRLIGLTRADCVTSYVIDTDRYDESQADDAFFGLFDRATVTFPKVF